tara:strand:- start:10137 stop:10883 length:747 start_codon:yes stop_codon:yes gene_type:complete
MSEESKKSTDVAVFDDDLLSAGTGLENVTSDDLAIPFIRVLQAMSPQVNKRAPEYVEGAEVGMLYNTVTNAIYDGEKGVKIIPCSYNKRYLEWIPREKGGGLVTADHDADIVRQCKKSDQGVLYLENGNTIDETAQFFILLLDEKDGPQQCVLSFSRSQLGVARKWNTILRMSKIQNSAGVSVPAPMFAFKYLLTTTELSNDKGTWFGFNVTQLEQITGSEKSIALQAKDFMVAAKAGDVKVKQEDNL